jgi:hypothetical protein
LWTISVWIGAEKHSATLETRQKEYLGARAMDESEAKPKRAWQPPPIFHVVGLAAAVLAVLVTSYFSVRAERTKALTLRYFGERPLLSLQNRTSAELAVTIAGERLQAPWLLSGRLENSGNQPIESRDIESPLQLTFESGRVVGVEIVEKSQQAIVAKASHIGNVVTINHALLNPSDWIGFDILFDGRPSRPIPSLRISGVSVPAQIVSSPGEKRAYPTLLSVPTPVLYLELIVGSLAALLAVVVGFVLLGDGTRDAIHPVPRVSASGQGETLQGEFDESRILSRLEPVTRQSTLVLLLLKEKPSLEWLENPKSLEETITMQVPANALVALGLSPAVTASALSRELKEQLQRQLAQLVYMRLPSVADRAAQEEVLALDLTRTSSRELIARAKALAETGPSKRIPVRSRMDKGELAAGALLVIVGVSVALLLGGTWRTVLGL